jgi:hypothetical protein
LAVISKTALFKLIPMLRRFVPVVGRGLALGFAVLALATAFFGMGDHPTTLDRFLVSALYAVLAAASIGIVHAIKPILRWMLRRS